MLLLCFASGGGLCAVSRHATADKAVCFDRPKKGTGSNEQRGLCIATAEEGLSAEQTGGSWCSWLILRSKETVCSWQEAQTMLLLALQGWNNLQRMQQERGSLVLANTVLISMKQKAQPCRLFCNSKSDTAGEH